MNVMLDTSGYSALRQGDPAMRAILEQASTVLVPSIVLGELESGFRRGNRYAENTASLTRLLSKPSVRVAEVTAETALHYAEIDVYLLGKGRPIPRNDVWIAACAMENGSVLLTSDAHFREIPMLLIRP